MKPDYKKYKNKLVLLNDLIKEKENEKKMKIERHDHDRQELIKIHNSLLNTKEVRNTLKNDIDSLNTSYKNKSSEINKMRIELRYNTTKEYDNMISKLESDMQYNGGSYKRSEEIRVLSEIQALKRGKDILKDFEKNKDMQTQIIEKLNEQKIYREKNNLEYQCLNAQQIKLKEDIKQTHELINEIQLDIDKLKRQKAETEKEERNAEINFMNHKRELKQKKEIIEVENDNETNDIQNDLNNKIKDCTKLINFLQAFLKNNDNTTNHDDSNSYQRKLTKKYSKTKPAKILYTFDELNLFIKLNCKHPKTYDEIEDGLIALKEKRDTFTNELMRLENEHSKQYTQLENILPNQVIKHPNYDFHQLLVTKNSEPGVLQSAKIFNEQSVDLNNLSINHDVSIRQANIEQIKNEPDVSLVSKSVHTDKTHQKASNRKTGNQTSGKIVISRQLSDDGYSGSQLSASSNVEQNPFFTASDM